MKRRDFLKTSAAAAGLAGSNQLLPPLAAAELHSRDASALPAAAAEENRSADFLRRVQRDEFLPKPPIVVGSAPPGDVQISPMPLAKRIRRGIVPRRGFCSLAPGNDVLLSGSGAMTIELDGDPYNEEIPISHESLFVPHPKSFECPNIADIFPQVRQMVLDGKYAEAGKFAYERWHQLWDVAPMPGTRMSRGSGFSIKLELPKSASVKDYLRTVDFESTEVKVHWTDERGEWVRRTFASRPDDLVVQWLTAPRGKSVNVRITVSPGGRGRGARPGEGDRPLHARLRRPRARGVSQPRPRPQDGHGRPAGRGARGRAGAPAPLRRR